MCAVCNNYDKYKPPAAVQKKSKLSRKGKKGMDFEEKVVDVYNKARRQPASGAFWNKPGDIITPEMLMEVKERNIVNSKGEKSITIKKEWLEKIKREAYGLGRPFWCLPFRFGNDEDIYVVIDFQDLLALIGGE